MVGELHLRSYNIKLDMIEGNVFCSFPDERMSDANYIVPVNFKFSYYRL